MTTFQLLSYVLFGSIWQSKADQGGEFFVKGPPAHTDPSAAVDGSLSINPDQGGSSPRAILFHVNLHVHQGDRTRDIEVERDYGTEEQLPNDEPALSVDEINTRVDTAFANLRRTVGESNADLMMLHDLVEVLKRRQRAPAGASSLETKGVHLMVSMDNLIRAVGSELASTEKERNATTAETTTLGSTPHSELEQGSPATPNTTEPEEHSKQGSHATPPPTESEEDSEQESVATAPPTDSEQGSHTTPPPSEPEKGSEQVIPATPQPTESEEDSEQESPASPIQPESVTSKPTSIASAEPNAESSGEQGTKKGRKQVSWQRTRAPSADQDEQQQRAREEAEAAETRPPSVANAEKVKDIIATAIDADEERQQAEAQLSAKVRNALESAENAGEQQANVTQMADPHEAVTSAPTGQPTEVEKSEPDHPEPSAGAADAENTKEGVADPDAKLQKMEDEIENIKRQQ
mmetsp:Transcript_19568/g.31135  ORF Transcript_19568/g.31135 Transcript_19568/m.31135 type:complete len:464 (-) Transcript_19568:143-1534(-)